jgi:uncharacterized membrane protein
VQPDGSLAIDEHLTFSFTGSFSGAYREIPLREGERVADVRVTEGGRVYSPGASAEIGSSGAPETFGTKPIGGGVRVVWHYRAADEQRTFVVSYRLVGLSVAYDDVVDVNLKVWGDEWDVWLDRLTATLVLPGRAEGEAYRVWGHPAQVRGTVQRLPDRAVLQAADIPPGQFVELRVVFPAPRSSRPAERASHAAGRWSASSRTSARAPRRTSATAVACAGSSSIPS